MDNSENEEQLGIADDDEEISVGQTIAVKVGLYNYHQVDMINGVCKLVTVCDSPMQ